VAAASIRGTMGLRAPLALLRESLLPPLQEALRRDRDAVRPISSGKRVLVGSDDPLSFVRARGLEGELKNSIQFIANAQDGLRLLDNAEIRIAEVGERIQRARILASQAANEVYATADKAMLAEEVNLILEDLVFVANSRAEGQFLFAGAKTDQEPFRVVRDAATNRITDVVYRGNRVESRRKIGVGETEESIVTLVGSAVFQVRPDEITGGFTVANPALPLAGLLPAGPTSVAFEVQGRRIVANLTTDSLNVIAQRINDALTGATASAVNVGGGNFALRIRADTPDQLFLRDLGDGRFLQRMQVIDGITPPTANQHPSATRTNVSLFSLLRDLRNDLIAGQGNAAMGRHLDALETGIDANVSVRTTIGGRRRRVEGVIAREESFQIEVRRFLSEAQDADVAEATTELALSRARLQAAAEAARGVTQRTLADFI
jgi:flagellar hook-associated protein 3 FlgL